jgi:tetratricopeptide (TPR) repeat protein
MESWHRLLAERHEYEGEWERAIRCYLVALDQSPDDVETYFRLARLYARLGRDHQNLDLLEQAGKVARAGRRRSEPGDDWWPRFDDLLGELQPIWEEVGGAAEAVDDPSHRD